MMKVIFKVLAFKSIEFINFKDGYFNSKTLTILNDENISDALNEANEQTLNKVAVW